MTTFMKRVESYTPRVLFLAMHAVTIMMFISLCWIKPEGFIWWTMGVAFFVRMLAITGGYHRYFSHKTYKTSRVFQFILGFVGCSASQRGPLWWAYHHREHHRCSDKDCDRHSPIPLGEYPPGWRRIWAYTKAIWNSHIGWVLSDEWHGYDPRVVPDLYKYPELRWLDKLHWIPPVLLMILCYWIGAGWDFGDWRNGLLCVGWAFIAGTILLHHATFTVNSVCHLIGSQPFKTGDESKDNPVVALITLGEGWHNGHHADQNSFKHGFVWWKIDLTYYAFCVLRFCQLVWDFKQPHQVILRRRS